MLVAVVLVLVAAGSARGERVVAGASGGSAAPVRGADGMREASLAGRVAALELACVSEVECVGTVVMRGRMHRSLRPGWARRPWTVHRRVRLAVGRYEIAAGGTREVALRLNWIGLRAMSRKERGRWVRAVTKPSKDGDPFGSWVWLGLGGERRGHSDASAEDLWGRSFDFVAAWVDGEPRPLVPETSLDISFTKFKDGWMGWSGTCNSHGSEMTITEDRLVFETIYGTLVGCPGERERQDAWFGSFLSSDPSWKLREDGVLVLRTESALVLFAPEDD